MIIESKRRFLHSLPSRLPEERESDTKCLLMTTGDEDEDVMMIMMSEDRMTMAQENGQANESATQRQET